MRRLGLRELLKDAYLDRSDCVEPILILVLERLLRLDVTRAVGCLYRNLRLSDVLRTPFKDPFGPSIPSQLLRYVRVRLLALNLPLYPNNPAVPRPGLAANGDSVADAHSPSSSRRGHERFSPHLSDKGRGPLGEVDIL